jgi:hypothetical protein
VFSLLRQSQLTNDLKAYAIAQHRATKKFDHLPKPADYSRNKQKYEFKVTLMTLKGGDSSTLIGTRLFFSYNVLFHSFLRTLQDETRLCIIPPLRINQGLVSIKDVTSEAPETTEIYAKSITTEAIREDDKAQDNAAFEFHRIPILTPCYNSASQDGEPSADDRAGLIGPNDLIMDTHKVTALNNGPEERSSGNDRGYTLEHGPWSYYVVSKTHPAVRPWVQLVNMNDYAEMLDTLKRRTKEDPQDEVSAIIMHVSPDFGYKPLGSTTNNISQWRLPLWRNGEATISKTNWRGIKPGVWRNRMAALKMMTTVKVSHIFSGCQGH